MHMFLGCIIGGISDGRGCICVHFQTKLTVFNAIYFRSVTGSSMHGDGCSLTCLGRTERTRLSSRSRAAPANRTAGQSGLPPQTTPALHW